MTLPVGARIGPYEITGVVGEGGMGQVYRARDERIGRDVAIKVLPRGVAADPERLRRFEQEARTAGMLNHSNLLTIFEFGTHDGAPYIVAELLEGETLRALLREGPLRPRVAVDYAIQLANGLAAAHERGVIHRDLKPENIFITPEGLLKVLDFGLAKLVREADQAVEQTATYGSSDTHSGVIVGTAGYMSPEQVRGQSVDHRADIFAFGAILYEMLAGIRAFRKESAVETMNAILTDDPPPLSEVAPLVPASLDRIARRCLEKKRDQRYQSARDLAFTLDSFSTFSSSETTRAGVVPALRRERPWILGGLAVLAAFALGYAIAAFRGSHRKIDPPTVRYLTFSGRDSAPAASPDGRTVAFDSSRDGMSRIWLKQLPGGSEVALTTGPDLFPRFSPDGSTILFTRVERERTSLWRVPVVGGEARRLIVNARDGDFAPDAKQIVFLRMVEAEPQAAWEVWVAAADGSAQKRILSTDQWQLHSPRWSADSREILLVAEGDQVAARFLLLAADGKSQRFIQPAQSGGLISSAAWSGGREIVYAMSEAGAAHSRGAGGSVYAHDVTSGGVRKLLSLPTTGLFVDTAGARRLVLDVNSSNQNLRETPLGAVGAAGTWLTHGRSSDRQPVYSADGTSIVFSSDRGGDLDLWRIDRATMNVVRITDDPAEDWDPAFTRDGSHLLWSSNRGGHFEIWLAEKDGSDAHQLTSDGADAENPTEAADGTVVYTSFNPAKRGLWRIRIDGRGAQRILEGRCLNPEVSPDGAYVAFHTEEVYVSATIRVARVADGQLMPFQAHVYSPQGVSIGRTRWLPTGKAVAFIGADERGWLGVYAQDFDPTRNVPESRRAVAGFDRDNATESFGIARDGSVVTLSEVDQMSGLMIAEGVDIRR
jgi:serine/threonine protein kinase